MNEKNNELHKYGALCDLVDLMGNQNANLAEIMNAFFGHDAPNPPMNYGDIKESYEKIYEGYKELIAIISEEGCKVYEKLQNSIS